MEDPAEVAGGQEAGRVRRARLNVVVGHGGRDLRQLRLQAHVDPPPRQALQPAQHLLPEVLFPQLPARGRPRRPAGSERGPREPWGGRGGGRVQHDGGPCCGPHRRLGEFGAAPEGSVGPANHVVSLDVGVRDAGAEGAQCAEERAIPPLSPARSSPACHLHQEGPRTPRPAAVPQEELRACPPEEEGRGGRGGHGGERLERWAQPPRAADPFEEGHARRFGGAARAAAGGRVAAEVGRHYGAEEFGAQPGHGGRSRRARTLVQQHASGIPRNEAPQGVPDEGDGGELGVLIDLPRDLPRQSLPAPIHPVERARPPVGRTDKDPHPGLRADRPRPAELRHDVPPVAGPAEKPVDEN